MTFEYSIEKIDSDRKRFIDLLLMADEQESMIDRYLDRGDMYVMTAGGSAIGVCVTTREAPTLVEIKNLAIAPAFRRRGLGLLLLSHVERQYDGATLQLGTGETPSTLRFYRRAGYRPSHRVPGFFTDNYDHPIIEEGVTLNDMIYLVKYPSDAPR